MRTLNRLTRRGFLRGSAATAGTLAFPTIIPSTVIGQNAPSNRVHIGAIGVGGRSRAVNVGGLGGLGDVRIIACADPKTAHRTRFAAAMDKQYGGKVCKPYNDFRELLQRDDIDAVTVCTSDHWHVPIAIAAVRAGKDMYVEKPLGTAMSWAWKLREESAGKDIVFQYGTQQRSSRQFQQAIDLVRNGYIGELKSIDAWCPHMDSQALSNALSEHFGTTGEMPVPEGVDYDMWIGPAPMKPYNTDRIQNLGIYHIYDYALGFIAGWGAHPLDIAQWGMDADATGPVAYEGTGSMPPGGKLFDTIRYWDVHCSYANGVKMRFMDEKTARPVVEKYHCVFHGHGTVFHGEDGWVGVDRSAMYSHHNNKLRATKFKPGDKRHGIPGSHQRAYIDSIRSRKPTINPLESAIRSDTISHLSDISIRSGKPVKWDPKSEKIIDGSPEQNAMLHRQPRKDWDFFI